VYGALSLVIVSMIIRGVLMLFLPDDETVRRKVVFWANIGLVVVILALVVYIYWKVAPEFR